MKIILCLCLAVCVTLTGHNYCVFAEPTDPILPAPPLPPAGVTGRVIDPAVPSRPLPKRCAPQGRTVRYSEAVPSTSRPVPKTEAVARESEPAAARPDATDPASYEGAVKPQHTVPADTPAVSAPIPTPDAGRESKGSGIREQAGAAPTENAPSLEIQAYSAWRQGNFAAARRMWEIMAASGHGGAMNNLGILWDKGQGESVDPARAAQWFKQSAAAGHPGGMNNYARMLEQGRGVAKHAANAAKWFEKAAQAGLPEAQFNLGVIYERGSGVRKNMKTAAQWYSKAAASQQVEAQARLAGMYSEGRGVKKDLSRAVTLAYGAALAGEEHSVALLRELAKRGPSRPAADFYGLSLASAKRAAMRKALAEAHVPVTREDDQHMCDLYATAKVIPGSRDMAICYAPGTDRALAFVKLEYAAQDQATADMIRTMTAERYGPPSAGAGTDAALWNLGDVVVATQYIPMDKAVSLMFMVPRVYHLTQQ